MPLFARLYDSTRKGTLLDSVPPGVTTSTEPVVAPVGTGRRDQGRQSHGKPAARRRLRTRSEPRPLGSGTCFRRKFENQAYNKSWNPKRNPGK
jgi:hypothetical protein